jgi:hypothetical protein
MNKQKIRVRKSSTDLDRANTCISAVLGGTAKEHSSPGFSFDFDTMEIPPFDLICIHAPMGMR